MLGFENQAHGAHACPDVLKVSYTAGSRSTSAGSSPSRTLDADFLETLEDVPTYPANTLDLPEYDYPTPWSIDRTHASFEDGLPAELFVKNTFLGTNVLRPLSLDGFFEERKIKSSPPPGLEDVVTPEEAAANLAAHEAALYQRSGHSAFGLLGYSEGAVQELAPQQCLASGAVPLDLMQALGSHFQVDADSRGVPRGAAYLPPQPADLSVGSPSCPTVGSQGHWLRTCKPCAFFHTKGCGNGINCAFCHLCEPDEKKKRAKEQRALRRCSKGFQGYL